MAEKRKNNLRKLWKESSDTEIVIDNQKKLDIKVQNIAYNERIYKVNLINFEFSEGTNRIVTSITFLDMPLIMLPTTYITGIFRPNGEGSFPSELVLANPLGSFDYRWRQLGENLRLDLDIRGNDSMTADISIYFTNPRTNHEIQQPKE